VADAEISLAELAAEERELQFASFDNDDAWALGLALVDAARERQASVAIDITRNGQQLFHAALPGTAPDNDAWIERKTRVVHRFGHSSLYMGQLCREQGTTLAEKYGLDPGPLRGARRRLPDHRTVGRPGGRGGGVRPAPGPGPSPGRRRPACAPGRADALDRRRELRRGADGRVDLPVPAVATRPLDRLREQPVAEHAGVEVEQLTAGHATPTTTLPLARPCSR